MHISYKLEVAIFATTTKTTFIDIDRKNGNLFELIKHAQDYIRKNIIWNVKITDTREEIPEIPVDSIREAIVNSYQHKLFLDPKGVEVSIFKDRVEIYNPGTFPDEYTPEDYIESKAHSILRNPIIAELLYKSKDSEAYSSGIQRIYNECKENNVRVDFRKEPYGFTIIFYRNSYNEEIENSVKNSAKISVKNSDLTDEEIILKIQRKYPELKEKYIDIIRLIMSNKYITQEEIGKKLNKTKNAVYRNIKTLRDLNIIQRVNATNGGYWKINL